MTRTDWMLVLVPVLLLLALGLAVVIQVLVSEPPEHAQVPAIQARFGEQLEILAGLAVTNPTEGCVDKDEPLEMMDQATVLEPWWKRVEEQRDRFADPTILGADIIEYCDGSTRSYPVKEFDAFSLSRPPELTDEEWPAVSLWFSGDGRFVRYEDRLPAEAGTQRGFRLILDLERLGEG